MKLRRKKRMFKQNKLFFNSQLSFLNPQLINYYILNLLFIRFNGISLYAN